MLKITYSENGARENDLVHFPTNSHHSFRKLGFDLRTRTMGGHLVEGVVSEGPRNDWVGREKDLEGGGHLKGFSGETARRRPLAKAPGVPAEEEIPVDTVADERGGSGNRRSQPSMAASHEANQLGHRSHRCFTGEDEVRCDVVILPAIS